MRRSNSVFKTAFVSEAGAEIANNDYFAYVEDDDFACYVLASGITDFETSEAAREVVEHLILSFEEKPSMAKTSLLQYMRETNQRLLNDSRVRRLKASVIMLVTDYEKFRYVAAGNVRLRMYRQGRFHMQSSDMSLANDMIKRGESDTPLDRHEERHNLYTYLGKKDFFRPFASKVYKLADADIIALYSQGLWENVDAQELDEIFSEASDKPQESVDYLEEVLLSRQPQNLKSYTIAAIFVNKAYRDPERERKRLRYIKIAVVVTVILILVAILAYVLYSYRQNKIQELKDEMESTQELLAAESYQRAQDSCKKALDLARELHRPDDESALENELIILDSLVEADKFFGEKNYQSAYENYLKALRYSVSSDKNLRQYIQRRLDALESQMNIQQFLSLGDLLFQNADYDGAESMYMRANSEASLLHDQEGRQQAVAALQKVYDKRAELRKDAAQQLDGKKQQAMSDAMKRGDDLLAAGDIDGAQQAYLDARNLSDNIADRTATDAALAKVGEAREKKAKAEQTAADELKKQYDEAEAVEAKGDQSFDDGDYLAAQMYYMTAIEKFTSLLDETKVKVLQGKFELAKEKSTELQSKKADAEKAEQDARSLYADKNFAEAKAAAQAAKDAYTELGLKAKADEMDALLGQIATDEMIAGTLK